MLDELMPTSDDIDIDIDIVTLEEFEVWCTESARRVGYLLMLLVSMPRVIVSAGTDSPAAAMFVWSVLALLFAAQQPRIPRAVVRRPRFVRLRIWGSAMLRRLGELPLATHGHPTYPPPWRLAN